MNETLRYLIEELHKIEEKIEEEIHKQNKKLPFDVKNGKIIFDQEFHIKNLEFKQNLFNYISHARWLVILTTPVIYSLIIPFILLDIMVTLYQFICFPVYNIPKVKRAQYLVFDRNHLSYLNTIQKINCAYCSYGNGIIAYTREVAARTEQYWCPIKHANKLRGTHSRYANFVDYGDGEQFRRQAPALRKQFNLDKEEQ